MKVMFTLLACLVALATAAPALAGNGQSATQSVGTAHMGSPNVSPAVSAPVAAQAPVCVAAHCSTGQGTGHAGSKASTATGGGHAVHQSASQSVGTAQVGSPNVSPAVSMAAPVAAQAPVCVAARCSTGQSAGQAVSSGAATTTGGGRSRSGQSASQSVGTVQVGSTDVSPAVSVAVPVAAQAPVCVAARCSTGQGTAQAGSGGAGTTAAGGQTQAGSRTSSSTGGSASSHSAHVGSSGVSAAGGGHARSGGGSAVTPSGSGTFVPPVISSHGRKAAPSSAGCSKSRGCRRAHAKACGFTGASARLNSTPTSASLLPFGSLPLTLLLAAVYLGLSVCSRLYRWVKSEARSSVT
jgi:hypothetical protein